MKKQHGFGIIEVLVIFGIIGLIGITSWYVWSQYKVIDPNDSTTTQKVIQETQNSQESNTQENFSNIPEDWLTYQNDELGFSFAYPKEYGNVNEDSSYGSENQNALRYTFYFDNICPTCNGSNPFDEDMAAPGIVEIGATSDKFGGIGTGRPYASSVGFEGEGNFQANGVIGLLKTIDDSVNLKTRTTIEFNLKKSTAATGIMFMTHDNSGDISNSNILKSIVYTFKLIE